MEDKDNKEFGGLDNETARLLGFNRSRAIAAGRRNAKGKPLPGDEKITPDDFRCDAEQVGLDKKGRVSKSSKHTR